MSTNNSSNNQYVNNSDGFALGGGTTVRTLTVTGGNPTITASGTNVYTMPASTDTLVGRDSTDTLTNKTLTDPVIAQVNDANGNTALTLPATTSAVNYIEIDNSATGYDPAIKAAGTDTKIDLLIQPKGTGGILIKNTGGGGLLQIDGVVSPANYMSGSNAATGNGPTWSANGSDTNIDLNLAPKGTGSVLIGSNAIADSTGWVDAKETWTYSSSATGSSSGNNYGVFTISGDKTSKYSPGMRVKYTQTTVMYGIITAVSYSSPNTSVTIYSGTDYSLTNTTIASPYYSIVKSPQGFPLDPAKWTITVTDTTLRSQSSPVSGTWYNLGSIGIGVCPGCWNIRYTGEMGAANTSGNTMNIFATLSTSSSTESDGDMTMGAEGEYTGAGASELFVPVTRDKTYTISSLTTYYLNFKTSASITTIYLLNDRTKLIIRAVCAYL